MTTRPLHVVAVESERPRVTLADLQSQLTVEVPIAGEALGLSRGAAYAAAKRGEIPTLRIGRRLLVPVPKLLELLGFPAQTAEAGSPPASE